MDKKRKLRNYLLNARFQLPFTIVVVGIAAVLTAGLGYVWYGQAREASRVIETRSLSAPRNKDECCQLCEVPGATVTDEQVKSIKGDLAAADRARLLVLIVFGIAFALLMAGYGIVSTHKVAGPLFKIARHMADIKDGRLFPLWGLRRGDQLQDFYETFRGMHQTLRQRTKRDRDLLRRTLSVLDEQLSDAQRLDPARLKQSADQLRELLEEKTRLLGPDDTEMGIKLHRDDDA